MKAALYIRVSTEEQALHGLSIEAQTQALEAWAKEEQATVVGKYVDAGISARKPAAQRPSLQRLLADIQQGRVELVVAAAMLLPLGCALLYGEDPAPFLYTMGIILCISLPLSVLEWAHECAPPLRPLASAALRPANGLSAHRFLVSGFIVHGRSELGCGHGPCLPPRDALLRRQRRPLRAHGSQVRRL